MEYRHSPLTRITHAAFGICFVVLALTGTQIFAHVHWSFGYAEHALPASLLRMTHTNVRWIHLYCGFLMIGIGLMYLANGMLSGELRNLLFRSDDLRGLLPMVRYYARLQKQPPAYDGYNPLQKLAYTLVLLTMGPLISLTGLALWQRIGGREILLWHLGFAIELVAFFFGHLLMVATTGLWNNVRSMITGWYRVRHDSDARPAVFDRAA